MPYSGAGGRAFDLYRSTGGVPRSVLWFRRFKVTLMGIGAPELIVIAIIIVILFGGKSASELGSGVGKAIANFKKGYKESNEIDISPKIPQIQAP